MLYRFRFLLHQFLTAEISSLQVEYILKSKESFSNFQVRNEKEITSLTNEPANIEICSSREIFNFEKQATLIFFHFLFFFPQFCVFQLNTSLCFAFAEYASKKEV